MTTASAASLPWLGLSATMATTASPTKRTTSVASGGRAKASATGAKVWKGARPKSAAVYTASTPAIPAAWVVSMLTRRAWATLERTKMTWALVPTSAAIRSRLSM